MTSCAKTIQNARRIIASLIAAASPKDLDRLAILNVGVRSALQPGHVVYEMNIDESHLNKGGNLHGGLMLTLVDILTSVTMMTTGVPTAGVTSSISLSYMNNVKLGETITIDTTLLKAGRSLAFTTADIKNGSGDMVAQGKQTLYIAPVGHTAFQNPDK